AHAWLDADHRMVYRVLRVVAAWRWVVRRQFRQRIRQAEPHPLWVGKVAEGDPKHLTDTEREADAIASDSAT
ncbi:MAG: hypothetical protein ACFE0K_11920, partial [Alcanivorax sp.]